MNPPIKRSPNPYSQTMARAVPSPPVTSGGTTLLSANDSLSATMFFTRADIVSRIYSADRQWVKLILTLETAGPVEIAVTNDIKPFLSGKGQTLQTGVPLEYFVPHGSNVYAGSPSVNRVKITVEPLPFLEQILNSINAAAQAIAGAIAALRGPKKV